VESLLADPVAVRGLIAAIIIGAVAPVLGCYVVLRGMAFLGDALAHIVLPGVVIAFLLGWPLLIGALIAGILAALLINLISGTTTIKEDSAIGVVFVAAFALGIALISLRGGRLRGGAGTYPLRQPVSGIPNRPDRNCVTSNRRIGLHCGLFQRAAGARLRSGSRHHNATPGRLAQQSAPGPARGCDSDLAQCGRGGDGLGNVDYPGLIRLFAYSAAALHDDRCGHIRGVLWGRGLGSFVPVGGRLGAHDRAGGDRDLRGSFSRRTRARLHCQSAPGIRYLILHRQIF